ncbi:hypothetical protein [Nocardioides aquiterrae]|uniref:DUF1887 family protein n=1 Tax=Nocardioides aquiterrae TaxID=203799 RepID=A0ABP4F4Y6_9ACTN
MTTGLVLLVGEQLWWDLEALAHWSDELGRVVLVGTTEDWAPGRAGDRLSRFVGAHLPAARLEVVRLADRSLGVVRDAIATTLDDPALTWIVSGAGGTRLMGTAAYVATQGRPHATFVVRDADSAWRRVDDGVETPVPGLDPRAIERYSAADLLAATWADDRFDVEVRATPLDPEIAEAARRTVAGAPWRAEFDRAVAELRRTGNRLQEGFLFERFVLAIVRALGVQADDVLVGTLLTNGHQRVQEVDVVVSCNGRLHVIDCKLSTTPGVPAGVQIRDGEATGYHLADGAEQYVLLRPNWRVDEGIRALAERFGIRLVDRAALRLRNLPEVLAELLGL